MTQFSRVLPGLLTRTDVVLELRDARLPLTSVNKTFEGKVIVSQRRGTTTADGHGVFAALHSPTCYSYAFFVVWGCPYELLCKKKRRACSTCG